MCSEMTSIVALKRHMVGPNITDTQSEVKSYSHLVFFFLIQNANIFGSNQLV